MKRDPGREMGGLARHYILLCHQIHANAPVPGDLAGSYDCPLCLGCLELGSPDVTRKFALVGRCILPYRQSHAIVPVPEDLAGD